MIFLKRRKEGFRDGCTASCSWDPGVNGQMGSWVPGVPLGPLLSRYSPLVSQDGCTRSSELICP